MLRNKLSRKEFTAVSLSQDATHLALNAIKCQTARFGNLLS